MATVTFNNNFDPNPGFEEILDVSGTLAGNATTFAITNNNGGTFDNYIFRLTGTGFTYSGSFPTGGSVTGVQILAPGGVTTIATITGIPNRPLDGFYNTLIGSGGVLVALFTLLNSQANAVNGSNGADHLLAFGTGDTLSAGSGNDLLWYFEGVDHIMIGGTGSDTFRLDVLGGQIAAIHGSAQNGTGGAGETDVIEVRSFGTTVGNVTNIDGVNFVGSAQVTFSAGNVGGGLASNLVVQGSAGFNVIALTSAPAAVSINLAGWQVSGFSGNDLISVDLTSPDFSQNNIVVGSSVRDVINGGNGNDTLNGGVSGDDTIDGEAGIDILDGGGGNDSLFGGAGDNSITGGIGVDIMRGEDGNDLFIYGAAAAVAGEVADGDAGIDTIRATGSNSFQAGSLVEIERFQFAAAATLTFAPSVLNGDFTFIGDGNINKISIVCARATTLSMEGFTFAGWATTDTVTLTGSASGDTVTGSAVAETINGNGGRDLISGENGNDILTGGASVAILTGGAGIDTIDGGTEADIIEAGLGNDIVNGGAGNDNVDGGAGNDILNSGAGYDVLAGGAGSDIFLFNAALVGNRDWISDFYVPADTIRLENAIFTKVGVPGVLAAAAFRIGNVAADPTDRIMYDNATGNVFYDRDGTGAAVQVKFAELDSGLALTRADFVVV